MEQQGLGWKSAFRSGKGRDTITSGLEGAWTTTPTKWGNSFFDNLFGHEWELTKSPAGANQWTSQEWRGADTVPDAHDPSKRHAPMMLTTDLALRVDPIYEQIAKRFLENPDQLATRSRRPGTSSCTATWDPCSRYLGPWVPEPQLWQDPVPPVDHDVIGDAGHCGAQEQDPRVGPVHLAAGVHCMGGGRAVPRYRQTRRGERRPNPPGATAELGGQRAGANGARRCRRSRQVQQDFNGAQSGGKRSRSLT